MAQSKRDEILKLLEVRMLSYTPKKENSLSSVLFRPISELKNKFVYEQSSPADFLWTASWLIKSTGFGKYN